MGWAALLDQAMKAGKPVSMAALRAASAGTRGLAEALASAARLGIEVVGKSSYGERQEQERWPPERR